MTSRATLRLVPFYFAPYQTLVEPLGRELRGAFSLEIEVGAATFDPEVAFDAHRGQYNSRILLRELLASAGPPPNRVLGLTAVDLFIPVLTYVFGEAQLGGQAALLSAHRLRPEVYGLPENPRLIRERVSKTALHELGHTYGLVHCHAPSCVMRSATYPEHVDLKEGRFCRACVRVLAERGA